MFNIFKKSNNKAPVYKFLDPADTACFVCDHVLNKHMPILHVTHDHEGTWQFICGENDHDELNAKIISIYQATELDSTINDLFEMPIGVGAERKSVGDKWIPFKLSDEAEEY